MFPVSTGPPTAGSGPDEKLFSGPEARADRLKIFTLNRKKKISCTVTIDWAETANL